MENRLHPLRTSQRLLSYLVCALIAWQPLLPALSATMTPVTAGTKLDKAANGVPVINIATPNGAGISHNQFKEYNVGKEGVILNNATGQLTKTQLGGLIQNNANLKAGQEAKGIINEVTGGSRSQLQGYTEVAGKGANVIVANPYGITCNGCGFINTPNVTLTTGKPQLDAKGNLQSLEVTRGTITVEGQGIDASQSDALSIISRATEVNAAIHARDLKVIAGANRVAVDGTSQAIAGEGAAPRVAVDTGALGGMYANRIRLVSSEKGVGVNLGDLNARQGDISLDASGKITLNKSLSSGALEVSGQSIVLNGDNKATGQVALNAAQDITLAAGTVVSDETISLTGNGKLAVSNGKLTAGKNIQLNGGDLLVDKTSAGNAAGDIQLTAQKQIDNAGQLTAGKGLLLKAQQAQNSGALVAKAAQHINADAVINKGQLVGDSLSVTTHTLANSGEMLGGALTEINTDLLQQSGTLSSQGSTKITADSLDNRAGGAITAKESLVTASNKLVNQGTLSAPELTLNSTQIENNGLIQGNGLLTISSNQLTNQSQGILTSAHDFALNLPDLHNSGLITSDAALAFSGNSLVNSGEISAASLTASNSSLINQQDGLLLSDTGMQLNLQQLTNNGQVVASALEITAAGVNNSGLLQGSGAVLVSGENVTNAGTLLSGGQLALQAKTLNNQGLLQGQQLTLKSESWQNSGNALSEKEADLSANSLTNSGKILGQQGIQLQSDTTDNQGWLIAQVLTLQGDLINSGLIQGNDSLALDGKNLRNQATGQLLSAGALTLNGTTLTNLGTLQADRLTLTAQNWQNDGSTRAASQLKAQVSGSVGNSGSLLSEQGLTLQASEILNQGTLAADRLNLSAPLLTNGGLLQGNSELTLNTTSLTNQADGKLLGGGTLNLMLEQINNDGLLQVNDALNITGSQFTNNGRVQADTILTHLSDTLTNGSDAQLLAQQQVDINARKVNNRGTVAANQLKVSGDELINSGLLQGDESLTAHFQQLSNQLGGQLLSGGELTVTGGSASNDGSWQGDRLGFELTTLANRGAITGIRSLNGGASSELNNNGTLLSQGAADLSAPTLLNSGKIMASGLTLQGGTLNNSGLWQGSDSLAVQAESLTVGTAGKALSGGALTLNAGQLTTSGTLQGERAEITADSWQQQGSVLGSGELTASVSGELRNTGDLLSQGEVLIGAQTLTNSGSLLSSQAMTLTGGKLTNSGAIQGKTVTLSQANVINQGSLIGLQALTLAALPQMAGSMIRMALAAPARELVNSSAGTMLTQGTLTVKGGTVTNNGSWQGQQILLEAGQLINNGSIQSADGLQLNLTDKLTSNAGSKITANGAAALQALALTNQGQWIAKSLKLTGSALNNNGDISGVDSLTVKLDGGFTQQQNKTLLSAGKLTLEAASVTNSGNVQGQEVTLTSGAVNNSGRMQGDNNLLMTLSGRMTNNASGTLVSQKALTLTTPELYNYGLIQSGATSTIKATGLASNSGKLLSGGELTLNTPQLTNSGWFQATRLILNAANAANSGTLLADQQATLSGSTLNNQGSAQGANLAVNYQQLTNNGTLLGTQQLNVTASQVNQQAAGKLFSGGTLIVNSNGFDQLGQVVALGDATLKIINAFTAKGILAAGNRLSVSSNGALENQGTMQGQALTVSASGLLTNNGQLTSGSGDSNLSGSGIIMNGNGSLQGGGNLTLTSRSDVTLNGFTGTRGSLTISTPGSLVNTALLYAANNLFLYANSIQNKRGDILAGNNLTLQRDAAGNANGEVVNTSGTIETQQGDITVNTGHLLNTRDGLHVTESSTSAPARAGVGDTTMKITIWDLAVGDYGYYTVRKTTESGGGCAGADGGCSSHTTVKDYYAPTEEAATQRFALSSSTVDVVSNGGAGRISSGRNMTVQAGSLENQASDVLAKGNITLSGNQLNNQSWQAGTQNDVLVYQYQGALATGTIGEERTRNATKGSEFTYTLVGHENTFTPGELYRAVIQAGGNVSASFSGDISNSNTTANAGWNGNTLAAPTVNGLKSVSQSGALQRQQLSASDYAAVNTPQWHDQLQDALRQVNSAAGLEAAASPQTALTGHSLTGKESADLGENTSLADIRANSQGASGLQTPQASPVDLSAYPLPSGTNGYFVATTDSKSPYLIAVNPKLDGLGNLDPNLFGDLNALLGIHPAAAPQETRTLYTDENAFLGSSYLLDRLSLKPEYDYRFLGDAAFDTRYVSNAVLSETGNRYINGLGSDLNQMRYLMDNAAATQKSLGLQFGVSLSADQVASLDKSIIWWEAATVNGEMVMVPKVYLSAKDADLHEGSVIAGNNVTLNGGNVINNGSTISAQNALKVDSQNSLSNLSAGLIQAGGDLQLSALNDINNVSSTISGKTVALESVNGDINNLTTSQQWQLDAHNSKGMNLSFSETLNGATAAITASDSLSLKAGNDINVTAATLSAGNNLLMDAWHDIAIAGNQQVEGGAQSGFKNGWQKKEATATLTTTTQGSQISAGGNLAMQAGNDLDVTASAVSAGGNATLGAGNDINLNSASTTQNSQKGKSESHASGLDRTTLTSGNDLLLKAGRDLNSDAAGMAAENDIALQAGRDLNLLAAETRSGNSYKAGKKVEINDAVRQQGTEIVSGGNTQLIAGHDLNSEASTITAKKDLSAQAGHDVNITAATESDYAYREETKTKKGLFSKKTTHTIKEDSSTVEKASQLSGDRVSIIAGNDLTVKGSSVVGESDVGLKAGNDLTIAAATENQTSYRLSETKKSGMFSGGGIGVTFGSASSKQQLKQDGTTQSQSASTIGSTGGNVTLLAGHDAHVAGSDVIAKQDISLVGGSVTIDPGNDTLTRRQRYEQKQSGLTLQLTSPITDALLSLGSQAKGASQAGDDRLKALGAVKMLESGWAMSGAARQSATALAKGNLDEAGIKIALSVGASKSKSSSAYSSNTVSGSSLSGGGSVAVVATGANGTSGDLTLAGSGITGNNVTLAAAHDLNLVAASNNSEQQSSNKSSGWSAGVHVAIGKETGIGVQASGYVASGAENGNSTTWVNSRVNAKDTLTLSSGNDTLLSGAQALGDSISVNAGNNLTLTSLQDTDNYHSKQQSASGGFSFTWGTMNGSAGLSVSTSKVNSEYASVGDQSGLFAGDGGYDIYTGNHTQLNGAVIASTADAANNRLSTGTLGWDSIDNHASYSASSASVGISGGYDGHAAAGQQFGGGALPTLVNMSGSASGTTHSAVADGTITVRDAQHQAQDVAGLSHDTENANGRIDKIFDREKVDNRMAFAQGVQELAGRVVNDVKTWQLDTAAKETADRLLKAHPDYASLPQDELNARVQSDPGYKAVAEQWGTGGTWSMVATAVAGALGGLSASNLGAAAGGAMSPYIANAIKKATTTYNADGTENTNLLANTMAHAVAGAVLAQMSGNSASAGAAGAAGGELAARAIVAVMYPHTNISDLTESQKQMVSTLSEMAAGLAGGIAADSPAGGVVGVGTGKNAVENNSLSALVQGGKLAVEGCSKVAACRNALVEKGLGALLGIGTAKTALDNLSASEQEYVFNVAMTGKADLIEKLTPEQREAYDYMVGQEQKGLITIFPQPDRDLTGEKLVNPVQDQNKGTTLTTPDQSYQQGATNTGNTGGIADTGGNTTVTPIPDRPGKDDLAYLDKPANLSPEGSARAGAFNEAKRQSGIPVSQSPSKVYPNVDRRKNPQPGYIYEFDVPKPGGGTQKVYIRDDAGGHFFADDSSQNRGPHFNDEKGNHYDY
ncbi:hemagglutinin repeat-containing protein [Erwinia sp. MMLR14_017]|uniref:hemagglutinin repeat-containing protein n=1 Tax=Erwinia sp. MMLR14_017 TaxID=3093842 RepID=UPI0029902647|nr:hemagglutinin repeat-containing protein [Erwinia sp. MMLR14_017]MDW8846756.1 hemagglutinin repeat-containing protein [Erwinia sp. MMLR14_017]